MNGVEHIQQAFRLSRQSGRAALIPYFTLGYPTQNDSIAVVEALARAGADLIELGMPFSDPLADGRTIQNSSQVALQNGMTVRQCLEMVRSIRSGRVSQPLLLMGYINPILNYGIDKFIQDASQAGVDGFIIPDLPVEEALQCEQNCQQAGMALVYLVAPTSTPERIQLLAQHSTGFLYLVTVTGVSGARSSMPKDLTSFVAKVREQTELPLAVGFGISTPAQVSEVSPMVDGVIVGSAPIDTVAQAGQPAQAASRFLTGLLHGLSAST